MGGRGRVWGRLCVLKFFKGFLLSKMGLWLWEREQELLKSCYTMEHSITYLNADNQFIWNENMDGAKHNNWRDICSWVGKMEYKALCIQHLILDKVFYVKWGNKERKCQSWEIKWRNFTVGKEGKHKNLQNVEIPFGWNVAFPGGRALNRVWMVIWVQAIERLQCST